MILTAYQYKLFFCAKKVVQYAQKINVIKKSYIFKNIAVYMKNDDNDTNM